MALQGYIFRLLSKYWIYTMRHDVRLILDIRPRIHYMPLHTESISGSYGLLACVFASLFFISVLNFRQYDEKQRFPILVSSFSSCNDDDYKTAKAEMLTSALIRGLYTVIDCH